MKWVWIQERNSGWKDSQNGIIEAAEQIDSRRSSRLLWRWRFQRSGRFCSLYSMFFICPRDGFIAIHLSVRAFHEFLDCLARQPLRKANRSVHAQFDGR